MTQLDIEMLTRLKDAVSIIQASAQETPEKGKRLDWASLMSARFPFVAYENSFAYRNGKLHDVRTSEIMVLGFDVDPDATHATGPTAKFKTLDGDVFRGDPGFYYPSREDAEKDAHAECAKIKKTQAQQFLDLHLNDLLPELIDLAEKSFHDHPDSDSRPRPARG